jgi:transposase-like protein
MRCSTSCRNGSPGRRVYPVVFVDALTVKIRDGVVSNRPMYIAIGVD